MGIRSVKESIEALAFFPNALFNLLSVYIFIFLQDFSLIYFLAEG